MDQAAEGRGQNCSNNRHSSLQSNGQRWLRPQLPPSPRGSWGEGGGRVAGETQQRSPPLSSSVSPRSHLFTRPQPGPVTSFNSGNSPFRLVLLLPHSAREETGSERLSHSLKATQQLMSEPGLEPGQSDSGALEWAVRSLTFRPCIVTNLESLSLSGPCQSPEPEGATQCPTAWKAREQGIRGCRVQPLSPECCRRKGHVNTGLLLSECYIQCKSLYRGYFMFLSFNCSEV